MVGVGDVWDLERGLVRGGLGDAHLGVVDAGVDGGAAQFVGGRGRGALGRRGRQRFQFVPVELILHEDLSFFTEGFSRFGFAFYLQQARS